MLRGKDSEEYLKNYKERLINFNNTDKYKSELNLLKLLLQPNNNDRILDYGSGIGTAADFIGKTATVIPYDVTDYGFLRTDQISGEFTKVYFMHSFAHIKDIKQRLSELKRNLKEGAELVIITPNKDWINTIIYNHSYNSDKTVVTHYQIEDVEEILISCGFTIIHKGQFGSMRSGFNERIFIKAKY